MTRQAARRARPRSIITSNEGVQAAKRRVILGDQNPQADDDRAA